MKVGLRMSAELLLHSPIEGTLRPLLDQVPRATKSEQSSWREGLPVLATALVEAGLGQVEMLLEYFLADGKRIDVILAGVDHHGRDTYVAVELKRWTGASLSDDEDYVLVPRLRNPEKHPLVQLKGYCDRLLAVAPPLRGDPKRLGGVAYLYNAEESRVQTLRAQVKDEHTRLFTQSTRGKFIGYLQTRFTPQPGHEAADRLLSSTERPTKPLLVHGAEILRGREHFRLSPNQQVAFDLVASAVENARRAKTRHVIVVTGGPGSGKSAIALELLAEYGYQGREAVVATGSRSFTESLRRFVAKSDDQAKHLFKYFNSFVDDHGPQHILLICDEAHRLRRTSKLHPSQKHRETGRPQIEELVDAAYVPLFLLDEHQVVRPDEIGTVAEFRNYANQNGLPFTHVHLPEQFRCGGSEVYDKWVLDLLGLPLNDSTGIPRVWPGDGDRFQVLHAETPEEMDAFLREKLRLDYSTRITAGFCWPWSPPSADNTLVHDISIDGWTRPWNVKGDQKVGSAPAQPFWAKADGGFEQVGCVYTAQGFEFDWAGVIIGPDLIARGGRLVPQRSASLDRSLTTRSVTDPQFNKLVRNIYKVLLTRALAGIVIYAVDEETRAFLGSLIKDHIRDARLVAS
ncbi:DUF2075 domain-containing protein [Acrocarpospora macrocephala]|uniref:ATP-binding protein n=1 Tax=Acrocarpospora macrocephala TaxID=150177 RepID=A0A5M3WEV5_9ACTN|nr:ATP-binding protein [Acrocarpospora macrocephala]